MLVADALDVVLAVAVVEHRRAFERFDRHDLGAVFVLEPVTCTERSRRAAGSDKGRQVQFRRGGSRLAEVLEHRKQRRARHLVVADVI